MHEREFVTPNVARSMFFQLAKLAAERDLLSFAQGLIAKGQNVLIDKGLMHELSGWFIEGLSEIVADDLGGHYR